MCKTRTQRAQQKRAECESPEPRDAVLQDPGRQRLELVRLWGDHIGVLYLVIC